MPGFDRRSVRRAARLLAFSSWAAIGAAMPAGCMVDVSDGGGWYTSIALEEETRTSTLDHVAGSAISVKTSTGSVSIKAAERKDVKITAKVRAQDKERLEAVKVLAERKDDSTLAVYVKWPQDKQKRGESCSFEIEVPDATGVRVDTSTGSIKIAGLSGKADLDTSTGSITVSKHAGEVKADTSTGSISVEDCAGPVKADTSTGSIAVSLRPDGAGPVDLDTSTGSISLTVGRAFAGTLKASTSTGSVSVPSDGAVKILSKSRSSAVIQFPGSGSDSRISASTGSISVKIGG